MEFIVSLGRRCSKCNKWAIKEQQRITIRSLDELDTMPFGSLTVYPVECCGLTEQPTHLILKETNSSTPQFIKLGAGVPVSGMTHDEDEMDRLDRGAEIQWEIWRERKEQIISDFYDWVIGEGMWNKIVDEILPKEFNSAFTALEYIPDNKRLSRSETIQLLEGLSSDEKKAVFSIINGSMLDDMVWKMYLPEWPVEVWKKSYGKHRIIWPIIHMPLAADLEPMRISAIAKLGNRKNPETVALFERIRSLEENLHRRGEQINGLNEMLSSERAAKSALEEKLATTYREARTLKTKINELYVETQNATDHRLRDLKGLISEMKSELKRYQATETYETAVLIDDLPQTVREQLPSPPVDISDKVIGIIGGMRKRQSEHFQNVITTSGDEEPDFEQILSKSDILVVLTQHVSHSTMWAAREFAIEYEKIILFSRHIHIPLIIKECRGKN